MKTLLTTLFAFSFFILSAQDTDKKETKEERQQRYIEEVNPFRELGYKPKIATLSNGKYREAFPDTIVRIGNIVYNKISKKIVAIKVIEDLGVSEADLRADLVSRWMSPDPLSDEFPEWSPYNFVMNNPIRFIDPEGLAPYDVIINGEMAQEAFDQLQASTSLTLTRNEDTGKVTATGEATTDADKTLLAATKDENITVEVNATDQNFAQTSDGVNRTFDGGAFFGSTVNEDGSVTANQTVNPTTASTIDTAQDQPTGTVVKHEVLEAYIGAQQSAGSGDAVANPSARNSAHNQANSLDASNINRNGSIIKTEFSRNGRRKSRVNITRSGKRTTLFTVKTKKLGKKN